MQTNVQIYVRTYVCTYVQITGDDSIVTMTTVSLTYLRYPIVMDLPPTYIRMAQNNTFFNETCTVKSS